MSQQNQPNERENQGNQPDQGGQRQNPGQQGQNPGQPGQDRNSERDKSIDRGRESERPESDLDRQGNPDWPEGGQRPGGEQSGVDNR